MSDQIARVTYSAQCIGTKTSLSSFPKGPSYHHKPVTLGKAELSVTSATDLAAVSQMLTDLCKTNYAAKRISQIHAVNPVIINSK